MTQSDTMSIGLNGMSIQGSSPVPIDSIQSVGHTSKTQKFTSTSKGSVSMNNNSKHTDTDSWVTINYSKEWNEDGVSPSSPRGRLQAFRARFVSIRFEIGFDNKDIMNDWMDAIDSQRDKIML